MRVRRIDAMLQWLFARLTLPVVTLCLLSPTINLVQLSDTGSPALGDELQYLHSLSGSGATLQQIPFALYCFLWEVRKAFVPFTMWLGHLYLALCNGPRRNAVVPLGIAMTCKALRKLPPQTNAAQAEVRQLEAICYSYGIMGLTFILYIAGHLLKLLASVFNGPKQPNHSVTQHAAANPKVLGMAMDKQLESSGDKQSKLPSSSHCYGSSCSTQF
ncbi:hypothetical protein ABBQ32_006309 [Trebouxia sp. C0010 RCD-2024]